MFNYLSTAFDGDWYFGRGDIIILTFNMFSRDQMFKELSDFIKVSFSR